MKRLISLLLALLLAVFCAASAEETDDFLFLDENGNAVVDSDAAFKEVPSSGAAQEALPAETPLVVEEAPVEDDFLTLNVPTEASEAYPHVMPADENLQKIVSQVEPPVEDGFLPVCYRCNTDRKVVAITIDDCNQPNNLLEILSLINKYGGKATIFPIGENVESLSKILNAAWDYGFEIENHTWDHCGLYSVDDEDFCAEICKQNAAVSKVLGVDYQMHFLRPRGGDNRYDQRTHAYLKQMGYYGIAYWSHVGVKSSTSTLMKNMKSGDILLYHTTNEDLAQLKELVPKLAKAGYTLVTLNELYGLPANETSTLVERGVEPLQHYERFPQIIRKNDYLYDVLLIQQRLTELGFLDAEYNGYYGDTTVKSVKAFQQSEGLDADGVCGQETWDALFPDGI